jgi:hypothetical protein
MGKITQLIYGVLAGTIVSVPAYLFVVQRDPTRLGSDALPAPSAKVWAGVAEGEQRFARSCGGPGRAIPLKWPERRGVAAARRSGRRFSTCGSMPPAG